MRRRITLSKVRNSRCLADIFRERSSSEKQRFLLKNMNRREQPMRPNTLAEAVDRIRPVRRKTSPAEFIDTFDLAKTERGSLRVDRATSRN